DIGGFSYLTDEDQQKLMKLLKEFTEEIELDDSKENVKEISKRPMKTEGEQQDEAGPAKKSRGGSRQISNQMCGIEIGSSVYSNKCHLRIVKEYTTSKENLTKHEMIELLSSNELTPPSGESNILDYLVDSATFGCCKPCPKCGGRLMYRFAFQWGLLDE
ncbi:hypothetical protein GCK32_016959, partial [Trichostrongylus colubriformis]